MDDEYTDKELGTFKKAQMVDIVMEQEEAIVDLTPNARKHGSHEEKELKNLRNIDLIDLIKKNTKTIKRINIETVVEDKSHNLSAYGQKGLTAAEVTQLQHEKSL